MVTPPELFSAPYATTFTPPAITPLIHAATAYAASAYYDSDVITLADVDANTVDYRYATLKPPHALPPQRDVISAKSINSIQVACARSILASDTLRHYILLLLIRHMTLPRHATVHTAYHNTNIINVWRNTSATPTKAARPATIPSPGAQSATYAYAITNTDEGITVTLRSSLSDYYHDITPILLILMRCTWRVI